MSPFAKIEYESGFTLVLCLDAGVQFIANGRTRIRRSEASLLSLFVPLLRIWQRDMLSGDRVWRARAQGASSYYQLNFIVQLLVGSVNSLSPPKVSMN